jgi:hypothetical protein
MRKEVKTLSNISKSPCVKACTMVKKKSKYIKGKPRRNPYLEKFSNGCGDEPMSTSMLRKISKWLRRQIHMNAYT